MNWNQIHKQIAIEWEKVLEAIEWDEAMGQGYRGLPMQMAAGQPSVSVARPALPFSVAVCIEEIEGQSDEAIRNLLCRRLGERLVILQNSIDDYLLGENE